MKKAINLSQAKSISDYEEFIRNETEERVELINYPYKLNLSHVSGHDFIKKRLKKAVKAVKTGRYDLLPASYMISGPVGSGKSYMAAAFAGELGIPMVKYRDSFTKKEEFYFEKALNILIAMSPVGVMIEDAASFFCDCCGKPYLEYDSLNAHRIPAQLVSIIKNKKYRGKIIWFFITRRPDLIPVEFKCPIRKEERLALFYPESCKDIKNLLKILERNLNLELRGFSIFDIFNKYKQEYSGADMEAILVRAKLLATMEGHSFISRDNIEEALSDFIPSLYPYEVELQNLVAVLECASIKMIPKRFRNMPRNKIISYIEELKTLLGEK